MSRNEHNSLVFIGNGRNTVGNRFLYVLSAGFLVFLTLFLFTVNPDLENTNQKWLSEKVEKQDASKCYISIPACSSFHFGFKTEISIVVNTLQIQPVHDLFGKIHGSVQTLCRKTFYSHIEYLRFVFTIAINFRKSDKLFPFHNFW
jgi:hypothetical protein